MVKNPPTPTGDTPCTPVQDLDHQINQLLSIETDLYNIYKTINTILQEQA